MQESERLKMIYDSQYYKDKVDQQFLELKATKAELENLRDMKQFCRQVQDRENARVKQELEENYLKKVAQQKEFVSLIGHVKLPKNNSVF